MGAGNPYNDLATDDMPTEFVTPTVGLLVLLVAVLFVLIVVEHCREK